jgi:multiple sugar transport system permease protein
MIDLKQGDVGEAASMSAINFLLIIVIVLVYLATTGWKEQVER